MDRHFRLPKLFFLLICSSLLLLSNLATLKTQEKSPCGWAITRFDYCRDSQTGRALVSNSLNTLMWNGSTWVSAIDVNCNTANNIWGSGGLGTLPPYPWYNLYDNGACWISKNSNGTVSGERDTLWVRHRFTLPNYFPCYRLIVEFFVDDSLIIYKNPTGTFPPNSGMIVGRDGGFSTQKTISFNVSSGLVILDFCVISTRRNYIGLIYGIKCDTCFSDCGWPIQRDDYCHDSFTNLNLVSNGEYSNIRLWNGTSWISAVNIPTTISRPRWGPPNYPFDTLFYNGACWISDNSSARATTNPQTFVVRHSFYLPDCRFYKLTVDFNVDDTLAIFYNHPFNSSAGSGIFVGGGRGFGHELKSVSFIVQGGQVVLDLKVISTTLPYIGVIYGIRCEEIQICDSITIAINPPPRPIPNQRCCFEFNIYNHFSTPIPMNIVRFLTTNGAQCTYATGPSPWTLVTTLPSNYVQFSDVSLQPGSNVFTLCFDRNPSLVLYLLWLSWNPILQRWDTCDCKYPFDLYCFKNCCDSFRLTFKTSVQQINYNTLLLTFCPTNILPEPNLFRFSAYVAYARRDHYQPNIIFDIIKVQSQYGNTYVWSPIQPPGIPPNTMIGVKPYDLTTGLPGVYGAHQHEPGFSRELIWGDVDLRNISDYGRINGHCLKCWFKITPAPWTYPPRATIYKFGIRYMFTDTTCCTCDTLVLYDKPVYPRWWDPIEDIIIVDREHNGDFTIFHHRPIDVNDSSFIKLGFDFHILDTTGISIVRIKGVKDGMTYTPDTSGKCKIRIKLMPGDTAKYVITFNNPKNILKFPCKVIEYYLVNGDTIPIERRVMAIYKVKGDEISLYDAGKPKDAKIIALLLRNDNLRKEGISHIIIKPKNKEKIIAIGSDAINMKAQLGIYNLMDSPNPEEIVILPEAFKDAIISELKPKAEIKPIYLAFVNPVNQPAEFIFETYNSDYELIADGEFTIPVSGVREDNNNEPISNLVVSPNPAKDNITISYFAKEIASGVRIRIYDISGKLIDTILEDGVAPIGSNLIIYSVSNLPSGQYFIRITCDNCELTEGFVIMK